MKLRRRTYALIPELEGERQVLVLADDAVWTALEHASFSNSFGRYGTVEAIQCGSAWYSLNVGYVVAKREGEADGGRG